MINAVEESKLRYVLLHGYDIPTSAQIEWSGDGLMIHCVWLDRSDNLRRKTVCVSELDGYVNTAALCDPELLSVLADLEAEI